MKLNKLILILITTVSLSLIACTEEDPENNTNGLGSDSGDKLGNSIISLPSSLTASNEAQRTLSRSKSGGDSTDDELAGIYEGIRCYVGIAEEIKNGVKELIINIGEVLPYLPVGSEFHIPDPAADDPKKVLLEKPEGEPYEWKLGFYYSESGGPDMIVRFTFEGQGAKGRLLWKMVKPDEEHTQAGLTLNVEEAIDVTFDGTTSLRTLEVRYVQDMSAMLTKDKNGDYDSLTKKQKETYLDKLTEYF